MPKNIIVKLSNDESAPDVAADYSIVLAHRLDAHLTGFAVAYEVLVPGMAFGVATSIGDATNARSEAQAQSAMARFEALATQQGIRFETRRHTALLSDAAREFGRIARSFDLAVVAQPTDEALNPDDLFVEAALFDSGRPVLLVPYIQRQPPRFERIVCCWDGSRSAARSIGDALPFLQKAKTVTLLSVSGERRDRPQELDIEMPRHLARHGLNVESKTVARGDIAIADTILSFCSDVSADFLVMGGYGHSRLREFVLGGVTRDILATMTLPVLMSH